MKYRPTPEEKKIIRQCAQMAAKRNSVKLEMGERYNVNDTTRPAHVNLLLVSNDWHSDTDLSDYAGWVVFISGVETTPEGDAEIDFYVSARDEGLCTNVQAHIRNRRLVKITEGRTVLWEAA